MPNGNILDNLPKHRCNKNPSQFGQLISDTVRGEIFCEKCGTIFKDRITTKDDQLSTDFNICYSSIIKKQNMVIK